MKKALLAGLTVLFAACAASAPPAERQSDEGQVSSPAQKGPSPGFSTDIIGPPPCPYEGGCEGDIHPSSGKASVDGNDCNMDGAAATMHFTPNGPDGENPGWYIEAASDCGALQIAGSHLAPYPQEGVVAWGNKHRVELGGDAATEATLTSGPIDFEPAAVNGTATVAGHTVTFTFYFGDEKK